MMLESAQRTDDWFNQRLGFATASKISDVMAKGHGITRKKYMTELLLERLTGVKTERYKSSSMEHGTELEAEARLAYEVHTFNIVTECGFFKHPEIENTGASPDGLIFDDGLIEIKCPDTSTHLDTLLTGVIDRKYILQMQWQMECTGRKYCDFISYDNRMPVNLRLFIKRIERDEKMIDEIRKEVEIFLKELEDLESKIRSL